MQRAQWLKVTLYSIGDAVIAADAEARVTFMNPVAEALTGWTAEDAAGVPLDLVFVIVNEETRLTVESGVARALRMGVVEGLAKHTLLIARDGAERPIDDSVAPIRDEAGQIAGVVLVFRDISERRLKEQALQDALAYADGIFATLREPLLVLDEGFRIVLANAAFYQTFDVSQSQIEGRILYDLGDGQWNLPELRVLLDDLQTGNDEFYDFEVKRDFPAIGSKVMLLNARRLHINARRIRKPGAPTALILLAIEDVTDERVSLRRMQASEQRYRRLFESARDGILILDAEKMEIIDSNPYMSELLGYTKEEFCEKQLWEIGLFRDKKESEAAIETLREKGYVRYEDLPLENAEGQVQEVEFICNVYTEAGHKVAQCNIRDITERKGLERQIHDQARALADTSQRKDEFLAMLSHELRNPIAPIFSALHLIGQQDNENEVQREARGVVERQVRHLSRLVDDLLEVSRITTGQIRLHLDRVSVNNIVKRSIERVAPLIKRREQELTVSLSDDVLWLHADSGRLEQVIGNILDNASKYTEVGGLIWLTVESVDNHAVIWIRDNGVGIAAPCFPTSSTSSRRPTSRWTGPMAAWGSACRW